MSDNSKEAGKEMEKAIFIPGDCWLEVFDFLAPSQLGLEIALISRRFDCFVDEHFKTRKWTLENKITIGREIRENGTKQLKIVNPDGKELPIPQNPLPDKVIGFRGIYIIFFSQNVLTFLRNFQRFFSKCSTVLLIATENVRISEFVLLIIWPMFKDTMRLISFNSIAFCRMRQLAPSMLVSCPSLQHVIFNDDGILPEFPPDDSANASDGQAVAKWLFSPHPDNLPKVLQCHAKTTAERWASAVEQIKAAFSSASSPIGFAISIQFSTSSPIDPVLPFDLVNELTGEILALSQNEENSFTLIRFQVGAASDGLEDYYDLTDGGRKNKIEIGITDDRVDDGLLNAAASAGPSGAQK